MNIGDRVKHRDGRIGTVIDDTVGPLWIDWRADGSARVYRTDPSNLKPLGAKQ